MAVSIYIPTNSVRGFPLLLVELYKRKKGREGKKETKERNKLTVKLSALRTQPSVCLPVGLEVPLRLKEVRYKREAKPSSAFENCASQRT